jgi:hypothetical protein
VSKYISTPPPNPFIPRFNHSMIGQDRIDTLTNIINSIKSTSANDNFLSPKLIIVEAGYGIGKTFTSKKITKSVEKDNMVVSEIQSHDGLTKKDLVEKILEKLSYDKKEFEALEDFKNSSIAKLTEKNAFDVLLDFAKSLHTMKIKNLVIQIDETDDLVDLGDKSFTSFFVMLRRLYDDFLEVLDKDIKLSPISIIMYMSVDSWRKIEKTKEKNIGKGLIPFMERISPNDRFHLREFNEEDARKFVVMLLNKIRSNPSEKLDPFEDAVINSISSASNGNPRTIVQHCNTLFANKVIERQKDEVTYSDLLNYYKKNKISDPKSTIDDDESGLYEDVA